MREDSKYAQNNLHWHDGGTCHGFPTLEECVDNALNRGWVGKVLEKEDAYPDGRNVKCYSTISGYFDHHGKFGRYVMELKLTAVPIVDSVDRLPDNPEPT